MKYIFTVEVEADEVFGIKEQIAAVFEDFGEVRSVRFTEIEEIHPNQNERFRQKRGIKK